VTATPPTSTAVPVAGFVDGGDRAVDAVTVRISLRIIERFSEGLYSSPNKTFEELVSNSYDAGAERVWVYLSSDLAAPTATIVVVDDGESMDLAGLRDLWQIGESTKRDTEPIRGRLPIGKFGIGKLATYVLARELTYVVHRGDEYLAMTMDYERVQGSMSQPADLTLSVASLTRDEAQETLTRALPDSARDPQVLKQLFANGGTAHWTAAILTRLRPTAQNIQRGRLRWVLSTALPLNPTFALTMDDKPVVPSKASGKVQWQFRIGESESELPNQPGESTSLTIDGKKVPAWRLPLAGVVYGSAQLFEQPLQRGKSEDWGRSHGFFVRVRQRLINFDDPEFDVGPELRHGTLTRFHMEIDADDLDHLIASPRESLQESPELADLKKYMLAVFNRARVVSSDADDKDHIPLLNKQGRIANPPPALTQAPFRRMLRRATSGEVPVREVLGLQDAELDDAETLLDEGEDLISSVLVEPVGDDDRLVIYDPQRKAAILNQSHPFISNYIDMKGVGEPLRLLGLTELLTEAYMLDEDIPAEVVRRVMSRRDAFLRALVQRFPRSALVVAKHLRDAADKEKELEDAVADALELLGFTVRRVSGSGDTDGVALVGLGNRGAGATETYALTYDAKSSGARAAHAIAGDTDGAGTPIKKAPRISAGTARTSVLRVHREKAQERHGLAVAPQYTLLVAPGFQGDGIDDSLVKDVCRNDAITPITIEDLARLIELFPLRRVSPLTLRELFSESRTPEESRAFVDAVEAADAATLPPVKEIIELLVRHSERKMPTTIESLAGSLFEAHGERLDLGEDQWTAMVRGLAALAPRTIFHDGRIIALNASPEALLRELYETLGEYPPGLAEKFLASMPRPPESGGTA
jgi:hypothetical protein